MRSEMTAGACFLGLVSALACSVLGCRTTRSTYGPPETPVVVEGQRWALRHEASDPLLVSGAKLVGLVPWNGRGVTPPSELVFVRGADGRIVPVRSVEDVRPHLVPITTRDQALAYVHLLRLFPIERDLLPGLSFNASPDRYGVIRSLMEEDLRAEGIDPEPRIEVTEDGFAIQRLVVLEQGPRTRPSYRLVRIRERVGRNGTHQAEVLETVETRSDIAGSWIWLPH